MEFSVTDLPARTLHEDTETPSCSEATLSSRGTTEPWKPGSEKICNWRTHSKTLNLTHQLEPLACFNRERPTAFQQELFHRLP